MVILIKEGEQNPLGFTPPLLKVYSNFTSVHGDDRAPPMSLYLHWPTALLSPDF